MSTKARLFNRFQFKDSEFDRFEKLDSCAALIVVVLYDLLGPLKSSMVNGLVLFYIVIDDLVGFCNNLFDWYVFLRLA